MMFPKLTSFVLLAPLVLASFLPRQDAASPVTCGSLASISPANVNAGLPAVQSINTLVAFGDSWTSSGASSAATWVELLASSAGATLLDYAAPGAVIDKTVWPGTNFPSDFVTQGNTHISEHRGLDTATTLYAVFFGINDFAQSQRGNADYLDLAAQGLIFELLRLTSSPSFAKNILVLDSYGLGSSSPTGEAYKQTIFEGVKAIKRILGVNVAFVDLASLNLASPSPNAHVTISRYVQDVLTRCRV